MTTKEESHAVVSPLVGRMASNVKKRFCRRQADWLWGEKRIVVPEFVPWKWGDGNQVIGLRPIILRRAWYVLFIDSSLEIGRPHGRFDEDSDFRELLNDSIYSTLEDIFGLVTEEQDEDFDAFAAWPMVNHEYGHEWFWLGDLR